MDIIVRMKKNIVRILVIGFFLSTSLAWGQYHGEEIHEQDPKYETEQVHDKHAGEEYSEKVFEPQKFIFDHIGDAYEWHILSLEHTHISIPLPVILISKTKGFHVFLFSKFHHGHDDYKGFRFQTSGEYEGKIVEIMEDGTIVRPALNLSITKNVFAIFISILLMLWIFTTAAKGYKKRPGKSPKGMQSFIEPLIVFIRNDIAKPSIGEKHYEQYMPYLLTLFFFILINNLLGLIPLIGGANVTGNLAVTGALAVFTFFFTLFTGNKHYWLEIFHPPGIPIWLKVPPLPLMPIIEIAGMFIKPFVLAIRLFANITAGHIVALSFFCLIFIFGQMQIYLGFAVSPLAIVFTVFMTFLELLVAFIQAYVFTLLSALYFGMAKAEHH